jgi:multidrug efflux pump subunit AcrA (membrane-fusion protein)
LRRALRNRSRRRRKSARFAYLKIGATPATRSFELAGEVRAQHETRLAFRVAGKIVERLVDVGALVRAGQPIARLDASDLALAAASAEAQVASAAAERELAAADHGRYKELRDKTSSASGI